MERDDSRSDRGARSGGADVVLLEYHAAGHGYFESRRELHVGDERARKDFEKLEASLCALSGHRKIGPVVVVLVACSAVACGEDAWITRVDAGGGGFAADTGAPDGDMQLDGSMLPDAAAGDAASFPGFVRIRAGSFTMGSPTSELGRDDDETQHEVTITRDFWLKETEVTQAEWRSLIGSTSPSFDPSCGDDCPVGEISWWDALAYVNRLSDAEAIERCYVVVECSGMPGVDLSCGSTRGFATLAGLDCRGYRLPTEAEWEYAARASTTTAFYTGEITRLGCLPIDPNLDVAGWYCGNMNGVWKRPVRQKASNAWGLFDMSGGAFEWVYDGYEAYGTDAVADPVVERRVALLRGGGVSGLAEECRSAARAPFSPTDRSGVFGFRVAKTVVP